MNNIYIPKKKDNYLTFIYLYIGKLGIDNDTQLQK